MEPTGPRIHRFDAAAIPAPAYEDVVPYYAELCALSELRKKPGSGVELNSGIGGHSLLYLNGVRVNRASSYPVLEVCPPGSEPGRQGAVISVNSHYRNANWLAVEDRNFVFRGALAPGEALTPEGYARTQRRAREMGVLEGIEFHEHFFRDKPPGMPAEDFKYEISVASDYAVQFGRDCYRARLPLDAGRMRMIVDFLNNLNAPYQAGRTYNWKLFNDNCSHVAHNALAAAGVWAPWPTGQSVALAVFKFPVPKNEMVDLARRANDLPLEDAQALFDDPHARRALLETGTLPAGPGALTSIARAITANDIYDVERLRLIFFDNPFWGPYRFWFKRLFSEPRYTDLAANLRHFVKRYEAAASRLAPRPHWPAERVRFQALYEQHVTAEAAKAGQWLARLNEAALPALEQA